MSAPINRSLMTIRTELEFLLESNVITNELYTHINDQLPQKYSQGMPATGLTVPKFERAEKPEKPEKSEKMSSYSAPSGIIPSAPPSYSEAQEYAEALYDYRPQQPEDIELRIGDKIAVVDKMSPSWWRGSCNGRTGIFPANYVKLLGVGSKSQSESQVRLQTQPQPQQYQSQQYSMVQQPQQQQQQQQVVQHTPQQTLQSLQSNAAVQKIGSKIGSAVIFGAGATIGSDIVNSIF
ncbi:hypothetical protein FOA43_001346 [Brettanomyces nanus]|uniref:SH3 domain-containing protein n=1 Tax=Eeniella nana TaxID=13502 RepID=A0A875RTZ4_EENNA|nr:uncharacterized protein FOA43_001346 [Brettanomyces nanus]QPG74027.1 hypothetical protein FOA43_001346 [Brettanomyces nanus]